MSQIYYTDQSMKGVKSLMNRFKLIAIISFLCLAVISGTAGAQPEGTDRREGSDGREVPQSEKRVIKHIILITVDDLSDRKMGAASTPNLTGLAARGIRTSAVGVLPANFAAFTASLLTGADPEVHGFVGGESRLKTATVPDIAAKYGRTATYISRIGSIPKGLFNQKGEQIVKSYEVASDENRRITAEAIKVFEREKPYFLGIKLSLNEKDYQGSQKAKTAKAMMSLDTEIGKLFEAFTLGGIFNDSLIIVAGGCSAPRSMENLTTNEKELMVPVIMAGPGLKVAANLPPVRITDIAPTAALLSGMQMPPESNGFILWNALNPGNGFVEQNLLIKRVKDLSQENARSAVENYRLGEEKRLVKAEKEHVNSEKQKIQKTIESKERYIDTLKLKITLMKFAGTMALGIFGLGYVIEYFYLRKKFLMF